MLVTIASIGYKFCLCFIRQKFTPNIKMTSKLLVSTKVGTSWHQLTAWASCAFGPTTTPKKCSRKKPSTSRKWKFLLFWM